MTDDPAYCIVPGCACAFPAGTPVCPECGAEQPTAPRVLELGEGESFSDVGGER